MDQRKEARNETAVAVSKGLRAVEGASELTQAQRLLLMGSTYERTE
jgi:hypothetical protein